MMSRPAEEAWSCVNASNVRAIWPSLGLISLNSKAYRHEAGQPRDFKSIFAEISGQSIRLLIEDPYLASGDRNRGALVEFLRKLQDLNVRIAALTLAWRPARPGLGYQDERPEDQQKDLSERLRKIGLGSGIVHLKPRTSRVGHFHDRIVTANIVSEGLAGRTFRWDITSGIDNLMERDRQCSVFLTIKEAIQLKPKPTVPT